MPLVLHAYGVPLPMAVAAVLGFRVLGTVLPAVAGTVALAGLRIGQPARPVVGVISRRRPPATSGPASTTARRAAPSAVRSWKRARRRWLAGSHHRSSAGHGPAHATT
jgi:hypothetical protein